MIVLGLLVLIVGIALLCVGRITANSLPRDYKWEDQDGFAELLATVGKMISGMGVFFMVVSAVILILNYVN